ncbi:hypothetical protein K458DRAFT_361363 [Lentithecium fluviatile CBS 122367]|uniref:Pentatricopeptide repeat protein-like protein n=1 Tax=Lentithecium fluviatile CBS 122367 TaxID=1168545 RepID=A0A6G1J923_9PLEO|nr:hypothetical protein K458DRAFT_361363 [Lentithecium fluviatile CBS 122367]
MLNCRACLWRCIRPLTAAPQSQRFRRNAIAAPFTGQQRFLRTPRLETRKEEGRLKDLGEVEKLSRTKREPWSRSKQAIDQKQRARATLRWRPAGNIETDREVVRTDMWWGKRDPRMPTKDWNARRRELQYLKDPLEVAAFVKRGLGKDKVTEMLQLVRMASHSMQCIVSWNHIMDYYLAKERMSEAMKVYNEMKKRAQFPDSFTYTILLRGLSINAHHSGALSQAISIYHSMSAPNSRVKPTIIHTNAVLRVCARALDMDALWAIAAKIPEAGPGAANAITYTTILNAIRQSLIADVPIGENEQEVAARRERGIVEGRRIWEDIISKWRNADLVIEEELVCSMGRLLLIGSRPRDWDDVLSLIEQTMDIPRLVPRLGSIARKEAGLPPLLAPHTPAEYKFDDDHLSPGRGPTRGDEFLALTTQGVGSKTSNPLTYATPGNNTLSIVLEACQKVVANKAADEYWNMLTDPTTYDIVPDVNNLNQRLRLLRQNRASAAALRTLKDDFLAKGNIPRNGTFRIAMSTCVRDKNNHNSLRDASEILHLMQTTLPDADAKAVTMYADLALTFPLAKGEDLVGALTYLQPITNNIRLQLGVGGERKYGNGVGAVYLTGEERQDAIYALRKVHAVYDRLLLSNMIAEERKGPFKAERARLSAFIQRVNHKGTFGEKKLEMAKEGLGNRAIDVRNEEANKGSERGGNGGWRGGRERSERDRERKPEGWRARNVLSEEKRRPWFSSLGASDSA